MSADILETEVVRKAARRERDWLGHIIQVFVIIVPVTIGAVVYWHDQATDMAVLQAKQNEMSRQLDSIQTQLTQFIGTINDKMQTEAVQTGEISTDLSLLRKELRK